MRQQLNLGIDGMHCAACSARVEKALSSLKGVISASVNLGLEEASLEYDDRYLKVEDVVKTIESLGYSVRESIILTEDEQIQKVQIARKNMIQMWIIAIIVMAIMVIMMASHEMPSWHKAANWIIFSLTILGMCFPARKVYISAFKAISTGGTNMDVLIAIGTIASLLVVPLSLIVNGIRADDFSGIAAMILAFHLTGRYLETKARGQASSAIRKLINLGAKTALVLIDDEENLVRTGSSLLKNFGYSAFGFSDPEKALSLFREKPFFFDAVISDYTMPRYTGFDLAEIIRNIRPEIPFILCSGYIDTDVETKMKALKIKTPLSLWK